MKRCRPALGTYVEIDVPALDGAPDERISAARAAVDAAFVAIDRVHARMSFHRADSDLTRLNNAAPGTTLALDPWSVEVLQLAVALQHGTENLFDCAVGAELIATGLLPGEGRARGSGSLPRSVTFIDAAHVHVSTPVCLDLGGLAKGYAVDRAIEVLQARGVRQAVVNAGGDLRVLGPVPQPIHVRSAAEPWKLLPVGTLSDGAMATSVACDDRRDAVGRWRSSLIDPRTRRSANSPRSWSVLASTCALADGLTKAVALSQRIDHPSLQRFGAVAFVL